MSKFGTEKRFRAGNPWAPGPIYKAHSKHHVPGPLYVLPVIDTHNKSSLAPSSSGKGKNKHKAKFNYTMPDARSRWMTGSTKYDTILSSKQDSIVGPGSYEPKLSAALPSSPRQKFSASQRFGKLKKEYISKDHTSVLLGAHSPGPKYMPRISNADLRCSREPSFSFGTADAHKSSLPDRSTFLNTLTVKNEVMYRSVPGTYSSAPPTRRAGRGGGSEGSSGNGNGKGGNQSGKADGYSATGGAGQYNFSAGAGGIGPGNYSPTDFTFRTQPRPAWGRAPRFKSSNKIFLSKLHARQNIGSSSPGPIYNPTPISSPRAKSSHRGMWMP